MYSNSRRFVQGFTLIELSIVLVIIGLIVGGVLVGRDLINAAEIRAQVSQIEKYQTAVNVFKLKYNDLPGDITPAKATAFGFTTRNGANSQGDGNGLIQGINDVLSMAGSELSLFWVDLSAANLIDGRYVICPATTVTQSTIGLYVPNGKLKGGFSVFAFNDPADARNYYGLSRINNGMDTDATGPETSATMRVIDAYQIDKKMDDGVPTLGRVTAKFLGGSLVDLANYAATHSTTTCYATTPSPTYSTAINANGNYCGLVFGF